MYHGRQRQGHPEDRPRAPQAPPASTIHGGEIVHERQLRLTGSELNRVYPFTSTEHGDREDFEHGYRQLTTKLNKQGANFSYMETHQRQQAERDVQNLTHTIHLKYFLAEKYDLRHANLDRSIQEGQDRGYWERGSFPQQALDKFRLDSNAARHEPFAKSNQRRSIQGPFAGLLGPGDPSGSGGAAHSSRITHLE